MAGMPSAGAVGALAYRDRMTSWPEVLEAVTVALGGDRVRGRVMLEEAWDGTEPGDAAQRCVVAHYLADVQDTLADEVAWDERALTAYTAVLDADLAPVGIERAAAMAPSLHLNLGDGYLRQGRLPDAAEQLALAERSLDELGSDGYGDLLRRGVAGLGERLSDAGG
jgi:hypothetical protein